MGDNTFEATETNFQQEVIDSELPVLIDFWAEWCGPCKMIAPIVEEIAGEYQGQLKVGKLDADANQGILQRYGIMAIPTLLVFKDGEIVERIQGYQPKKKIVGKLQTHLS